MGDLVCKTFRSAPPNWVLVQYLLKHYGPRNMALMYSICMLATKDIVTPSTQDEGCMREDC